MYVEERYDFLSEGRFFRAVLGVVGIKGLNKNYFFQVFFILNSKMAWTSLFCQYQ